MTTCSNHAGLDERINGLRRDMDKNEQDHNEMWTAINNLRNRLPVWATVVIALLTGLLGWVAR